MIKQNYYQNARENEEVFRNILNDMKLHRENRPLGFYIPVDLDVDLPIDDLFLKYSEGQRMRKFTILNFTRLGDIATLSFQDVAPLSGGGTELEYLVKPDNSVEFKKNGSVWMS